MERYRKIKNFIQNGGNKPLSQKILTVYQNNDLQEAIQNFIKSHVYNNDVFDLVDSNGKKTTLLVKNSAGNVEFILKLYDNPLTLEGSFLREIFSLEFLNNINLFNKVLFSCLIAIRLAYIQNRVYGMILESAVKGQTLESYVLEVMNWGAISHERQIALGHAQQAFSRMGEGLAALHANKSKQLATVPIVVLQELQGFLQKITKLRDTVICLEKFISMSSLNKFVEKIIVKAKNVPLIPSYWHGDASLKNMMYDIVFNQFYLIDVETFYQSIDKDGQLIGDGMKDLLQMEEYLCKIAFQRLTEQELNILINSFYNSYDRVTVKTPNNKFWRNFYCFYFALRRISFVDKTLRKPYFDYILLYISDFVKCEV